MDATPATSLLIERTWPFANVFSGVLAQPVIAIGNFDGVHLGHLAVMNEAKALSAKLERPLVALTFEP
ncbi:MAG: hypothetical protein ACRCWO_09610, partial [Bosea sp. (in: a-proteobacteria)]